MKKRIVIVGLGALGSHLALFLRNIEMGLMLVDFDRVETKNTMSQFHTRMGKGRNKVQALQQALQGMWGVKVGVNTNKLTEDNVEAILGGPTVHLVVDCTDNGEARCLIQTFCKDHGTPCVHGTLSAGGDFSRVVWTEHFVIDEEDEEGQATCEDGAQLPFYAVAAGQIAQVVQAFIEKGEKRSFQIGPTHLIRLA